MKKLLVLLSVACMFTLATQAQEISAEQSLQRAVATMSKKSYARKVRGKADFTLTHTQKSQSNGKALYYVFRNGRNDGFMITAADQRANAVLGYTENGTYEQALGNPAFQSWMGTCQDVMQWLSNKEVTGEEAAVPECNIPDRVVSNADRSLSLTIPGRRYAQDNTLPESVEPLLGGIKWDQDAPYNRQCPTLPGTSDKCAVGCVATATAQVMKYYQWPKQGTGQHSYVSDTHHFELSADFSQSTYDWDNMLDDYSGVYTNQQANAVAKLMSDVGIAENTNYDEQSTSASMGAVSALVTYFGYNKGAQICCREFYSHAEWNDLLRKELTASRPILMSGRNCRESVGHQFVLDGYDKDGMYHVNWGWGGLSNGYYDINIMCPKDQGTGGSSGGYAARQNVTINCFPDRDGTSVAHPMLVVNNQIYLKDDAIRCSIYNLGLAPFIGRLGCVATIDDEIIASYFYTTSDKGIPFYTDKYLTIPLSTFGITPENIGSNKCKVYPVYDDGTGLKVPMAELAFQDYLLLSVNEKGQIVSETIHDDNANLTCKSIEITRDYAGFNINATALISNDENSKAFDHELDMFIHDEDDNTVATGTAFAHIGPGETASLEFCCEPYDSKQMEPGKTYRVYITQYLYESSVDIPGGMTTITLKDPGAEPSLSYSDFAIDKTVLAPGEDLTVSFKVQNTGGFTVQQYYVYVFRNGATRSMGYFPLFETDLPNGTTTFTSTHTLDFEEGNYHILVSTLEDYGWNDINDVDLNFSIKASPTGVSHVTNTPDSAHYYDLQGRRVANPSKGIYVKNGKKVILKL